MTAPLDRRILLLATVGGLPAVLIAEYVIWRTLWPLPVRLLLVLALLGSWIGCAIAARRSLVNPLHTLANLLTGIRQGDFSLRARGADARDPLGAVFLEYNELGEALLAQHVSALEATALLRRIMEEIDVAVFAFDAEERLQLVNRAGERLLGQPEERMIGHTAQTLGLAEARALPPRRTLDATFGGASGRWEVRRGTFRQGGRPMELVVISDLTRTLREEERQVWQRLVRVLSHEINNSLAPIRSLAGTLTSLLDREPRAPDAETDLRRGLDVIGTRAESLNRFMAQYARLARLPAPKQTPIVLKPFLHRLAGLETRVPVQVRPGPDVTISADPDQLEQLFINLLRNAADATLEVGGGTVTLGWRRLKDTVGIWVDDEGPGLSNTANLFVPFFTTKPGGSGIGLVLCRQIAEAHEGSLRLENRADRRGCRAALTLPA